MIFIILIFRIKWIFMWPKMFRLTFYSNSNWWKFRLGSRYQNLFMIIFCLPDCWKGLILWWMRCQNRIFLNFSKIRNIDSLRAISIFIIVFVESLFGRIIRFKINFIFGAQNIQNQKHRQSKNCGQKVTLPSLYLLKNRNRWIHKF